MLKKEISGRGLLQAFLLLWAITLAVGAVIVGGTVGRNAAIIAVMIAVLFGVDLVRSRPKD